MKEDDYIGIDFIRQNFKYLSGVYILPEIPDEKFELYYKDLPFEKENDVLLAIIENNFDENFSGFALFGRFFIYKEPMKKSIKVFYNSIKNDVVIKNDSSKSYLVVENEEFFIVNHEKELMNFINYMKIY